MSISRSENMRRIRSSDTEPELLLRRRLHAAGFRYVLHHKKVVGKPDIVMPCRKAAIFVHGCFWHRHYGCSRATFPNTNETYWREKFARNVRRDADVQNTLRLQGWNVIIVWECQLRRAPDKAAMDVIHKLSATGHG